jgi:hypothetical protein
MANWAKGLDALGAGLLRQADIGGLAYQDATKKEAERRAETRELAAERRANTQLLATEERRKGEWDRQQLALEQAGIRGEIRGDTRFTTRLKEEGDARIVLEDKLIDKRYDSWKKQYDIESTAKVKAAEDKAKITALKLRYEKAQSAYESLVKEFGDKPEGQGWKYAYRAQQDALQAWNDYSAASGLKMQINPEIDRLRIRTTQALFTEILAVDLQEEGPFNDFIKALEQGYGPGKEPNKASEDAMKTINDAIERLGILLPEEEKSAMLNDLVKAFLDNPNLREGVVTVGDPIPSDDGNGNVSFKRQAGDPIDRIDVENLEVGAFKRAIDAQGRPGRSGTKGTQGAKWRDPEWLLPRLESELNRLIHQRDAPGRGSAGGRAKSSDLQQRITRIQDLILKMEALLPVVNNESGASLMAVPQRGMIAAVDQGISPQELAYWEPDVTDARAKATQQQRMTA